MKICLVALLIISFLGQLDVFLLFKDTAAFLFWQDLCGWVKKFNVIKSKCNKVFKLLTSWSFIWVYYVHQHFMSSRSFTLHCSSNFLINYNSSPTCAGDTILIYLFNLCLINTHHFSDRNELHFLASIWDYFLSLLASQSGFQLYYSHQHSNNT